MGKTTMRVKLMQAGMFASQVKSLANNLDYYCDDDDYREGRRIASELLTLSNNFIKLLKDGN